MARCAKCGNDAGFMATTCRACLELDRQRWVEEMERRQSRPSVSDQAAARRRVPGFTEAAARVQLTTTPTLPGFSITETVEVVATERIMPLGLGELFGVDQEGTRELLDATRRRCLQDLKEAAAALGADAVVAVRLDYGAVGPRGQGVLVSASGTAVCIAPVWRDGPKPE